MSPFEKFRITKMKFETKQFRDYFETSHLLFKTVDEILESHIKRVEKNKITAEEDRSYLLQMYANWTSKEQDITFDEFKELFTISYISGVNSTATMMQWVLFHIAQNPEIQSKLLQEIDDTIGSKPLSEMEKLVQEKVWFPYMNAVIREVHRLTPTVATIVKDANDTVQTNDYQFPKGEMFYIDTYSIQNDRAIVGEDVNEFKPERWFHDEVQKRKGTKAEILDHKMLSAPFSHGQRHCPGETLANLKTKMFLTQILRDWKVRVDVPQNMNVELENYLVPNPYPTYHFERR